LRVVYMIHLLCQLLDAMYASFKRKKK